MPGYSGQQGQGGGPPTAGDPTREKVNYWDGDRLSQKLVDEEAEQWAQKLKGVAASQLRRFYEHVLSLERRLDMEAERSGPGRREEIFGRLLPEFKMLKAKAYYAHARAKGREKEKMEGLRQFFIIHVAAVQRLRDFEAFTKHFQAVVAFHKFFAESTRER